MISLLLITLIICLVAIRAICVKFYTVFGDSSKNIDDNDAVLISCCNSGLGLALARHLHESCRFKLICAISYDETNLGARVKLEELNPRAGAPNRVVVVEEVVTEADVTRLVGDLTRLRSEGYCNKLVAFVITTNDVVNAEFDWQTLRQIQRQFDRNLLSTVRLTHALIPYLMESEGTLVFTTSVAEQITASGLSIYKASKSGLSTFSRNLGYELRKYNIHVVNVKFQTSGCLDRIRHQWEANKEEMWAAMDGAKRDIYEKSFKDFNDRLELKLKDVKTEQIYGAASLMNDLQLAITAKHPPSSITHASIVAKIACQVMGVAPDWLQYSIIDLVDRIGSRGSSK